MKALVLAFLMFSGCAAAGPTQYGLDLAQCVAEAGTKAESQACRCEANKRVGRPCVPGDGGL